MTPHDRRIVHMALKDRTDVVTRSEGDEGRRRIIVEPAGACTKASWRTLKTRQLTTAQRNWCAAPTVLP